MNQAVLDVLQWYNTFEVGCFLKPNLWYWGLLCSTGLLWVNGSGLTKGYSVDWERSQC